jgi:molybdate transport system substrate-binding protein
VRITAVAPEIGYRPAVHSMAMERYCPDRQLCADFLDFVQTPDAQAIVRRLGYVSPSGKQRMSLPR